MFEIEASDEVLFASVEALEARHEQIEALLSAIDLTWHEIVGNPGVVARELRQPTLAGDLPRDIRDTLVTWMTQAVEAGIFPGEPNEFRAAAKADLDWYLPNVAHADASGDLHHFWDFGPIESAHAAH